MLFTIDKPFEDEEQTAEISAENLSALISIGWSQLGLAPREEEAIRAAEEAVRDAD